jgi:DNA-binding FadR family transcriptional regulator
LFILIAELERILEDIARGCKWDVNPFQHAPYFQHAIAKASHNQVLANMVKSFVRLMQHGAEVIAQQIPNHREREYKIHAELYEPILRRDPEQARERMRLHIDDAKNLITQGFSEISESQPGQ